MPRRSAAWRSWEAARGRRRRASSNTRRSADILTRCSRQARRPASRLAAGIDAASMARRCQKQLLKIGAVFSPPAQATQRQGGQGLVSQAVAPRLGHPRHVYEGAGRGPLALRGGVSTERPRTSRPSRPDFRWPHAEETSPCPPCRRYDSGQREAQGATNQPRRNTPQKTQIVTTGPRPTASGFPEKVQASGARAWFTSPAGKTMTTDAAPS